MNSLKYGSSQANPRRWVGLVSAVCDLPRVWAQSSSPPPLLVVSGWFGALARLVSSRDNARGRLLGQR